VGRPHLRRLGLAAIVVVFALAGAWAAPRIVGPGTYRTTVADVQLRVGVSTPADRGLNLYVPLADWGLRSRVIGAPVRVSAEPRRINRDGVVRIVTAGGTGYIGLLRSELDAALRAAAVRFGLVSLAGALAGGLVAVLAWHALGVRRWRLLLAPAGALALTLVVGGGLAAWGASSFDASRLERPEY
jgi:hypothetical protein